MKQDTFVIGYFKYVCKEPSNQYRYLDQKAQNTTSNVYVYFQVYRIKISLHT